MFVRFCLAAVVLAAATTFPLSAAAQTVTATYGPFSIATSTGTQLSGPVYSISATTTGTLLVRYNASAGHCSDVRAHVLVDGVERGVTAFLAPGESSAFIDVGPVSSGAHVVALQGEGRVSGCNTGGLVGWGGTVDVTTSVAVAQAPQPVPGPGLLVTLLGFAAGAFAFGPFPGRRRS